MPSITQVITRQARELHRLGEQARRSGDFATAATYFEQHLDLYVSNGYKEDFLENPLINLFKLAAQQQAWVTARDYLYWLISLPTFVDDIWLFYQLGTVEGHLGHHEFARQHFAQAYDLCMREPMTTDHRDVLWQWGQFEYRCGDQADGKRLCELAILTGQALCNRTPEGKAYPRDEAFREGPCRAVAAYEAQFAQMLSD